MSAIASETHTFNKSQIQELTRLYKRNHGSVYSTLVAAESINLWPEMRQWHKCLFVITMIERIQLVVEEGVPTSWPELTEWIKTA